MNTRLIEVYQFVWNKSFPTSKHWVHFHRESWPHSCHSLALVHDTRHAQCSTKPGQREKQFDNSYNLSYNFSYNPGKGVRGLGSLSDQRRHRDPRCHRTFPGTLLINIFTRLTTTRSRTCGGDSILSLANIARIKCGLLCSCGHASSCDAVH